MPGAGPGWRTPGCAPAGRVRACPANPQPAARRQRSTGHALADWEEPAEQLVQAVHGLDGPFRHPGLKLPVTVFDRLENRVLGQQGLAAEFLEGDGPHRDVARQALELEGLHDAGQRRRAVEDAVESVLVAVDVPVDVAPPAAVMQVKVVDGHRQLAWPEPLHQQVRIGVGAEEKFPRGGELSGDHDLWGPGFGDDLCAGHAAYLPASPRLRPTPAVPPVKAAAVKTGCGRRDARMETGRAAALKSPLCRPRSGDSTHRTGRGPCFSTTAAWPGSGPMSSPPPGSGCCGAASGSPSGSARQARSRPSPWPRFRCPPGVAAKSAAYPAAGIHSGRDRSYRAISSELRKVSD